MYQKVLWIILLSLSTSAFAQLPLEKTLVQKVQSAQTDREKSAAMGELASFYSLYRADKKADSILQLQLSIAEASNDKELIAQAFYGPALDNIQSWSNKETFDRALTFSARALIYAQETKLPEMEITAHLKAASLLRKRNDFARADEMLLKAFPLLQKHSFDSLQTLFYLEMGDCFQGKGNPVEAYRNYNEAYNITYRIKNYPLQATCLHRFSDLYKSLGELDEAKKSLEKSIEINTAHGLKHGLVEDYYDLARLTDKHPYLHKGMALADSLNAPKLQLRGKFINLSFIMVVEQNSEKALAYLNHNPDLLYYYFNQGMLDYYIGNIYMYGKKFDLAVQYFKRAEPGITQGYTSHVRHAFFKEMSKAYSGVNQTEAAIDYALKAYAISKDSASSGVNAEITQLLGSLYALKKDYHTAYTYKMLNEEFEKDVKQSAKQRQMSLMAVQREQDMAKKDLEDTARAEAQRRDAQYMGITFGTVFLFIVLMLTGMFAVSKLAVRILNFFAFICLFEFIILLIDNWLHHTAHGQPLIIWGAKIFIIALLLPLHHWLEHIAVKFLDSGRLQKIRLRFSVKELLHPSRKSIEKLETNLEESTLI